jgi:hypothetical protein
MKKPRLSVEMIPRNCWRINVRSVLTRNDWNEIRGIVYRKAEYKCEICGGQGKQWPVECHEIWRYNDKTKVQQLVGLQALCPDCHAAKHPGSAKLRGYEDRGFSHLKAINGWNQKELDRYITKIQATYNQRNKFEWTLDLSWLEKIFGIKLKEEIGFEKSKSKRVFV